MYPMESKRNTYAEIDLEALKQNLRAIIGRLRGTRPIAVVKADAYGHGAVRIALKLKEMGINRFAVSNLDEAIELRDNGLDQWLMVLGPVPEKYFPLLDHYQIVPTVSYPDYARALLRQKIQIPVQVKIDTGMGRLGIPYSQSFSTIKDFLRQGLKIEGIFSHFPSADSDPDFTQEQIEKMTHLVQSFHQQKIRFKDIHIANSYALFRNASAVSPPFSWVRPGLALYGYVYGYQLKETLSLKSSVVEIKKFSKGDTLSYSRSYQIQKEKEWIAILPIGYADGLPLSLSNKGKVAIASKQYPIVGRICMDYTLVSLGESTPNVKIGDSVTVIGENAMSVKDFSELSGKIPYESTCGITKRVPRIYIDKRNEK